MLSQLSHRLYSRAPTIASVDDQGRYMHRRQYEIGVDTPGCTRLSGDRVGSGGRPHVFSEPLTLDRVLNDARRDYINPIERSPGLLLHLGNEIDVFGRDPGPQRVEQHQRTHSLGIARGESDGHAAPVCHSHECRRLRVRCVEYDFEVERPLLPGRNRIARETVRGSHAAPVEDDQTSE